MDATDIRADIQCALRNFTDGNLAENSTHLLKALGYESQRTLNREANIPEAFLNLFFATLNQEMNTSEKPNNRKFRGDGRQHYNI